MFKFRRPKKRIYGAESHTRLLRCAWRDGGGLASSGAGCCGGGPDLETKGRWERRLLGGFGLVLLKPSFKQFANIWFHLLSLVNYHIFIICISPSAKKCSISLKPFYIQKWTNQAFSNNQCWVQHVVVWWSRGVVRYGGALRRQRGATGGLAALWNRNRRSCPKKEMVFWLM